MKKLFKIIAFLVLAVLAVSVAAGLYLISYSLTPDSDCRDYDAAYQSLVREYPCTQGWVDSLKADGLLRDTVIRSESGDGLHAIYAPARKPTDRTAVIVHGYTDNAVRMMMIGYMYHHDLGFNILLPDLRYHGQSDGRAIQMGWLDRWDVLNWIGVADGLFGGDTRVVVHGISMGAATTMMLSGEELPECVRCFVEDCGYTSVWDQFEKELREQFSLPAFPLLHIASIQCALKYGWNFREASALEQVKKCSLPMLFIHGDADDYVPTEMVYRLYEAKSGEKELWVAPDAPHARSYKCHPEEYTRRVREFVGRYIPAE